MNSSPNAERLDVVVVGAGLSGLYLLHRLRADGFRTLVLEAGDGIGGTWYWNRYPGARCDIESLTYSYSFSPELEQEWRWTERYATQPEILRYIEHVADRFDLRRDVRLATRVTGASFDEAAGRWTVETEQGATLDAAFVVCATGCLSVPRDPAIPGLERFAGERYHTGRWPHDPVSFAGKRVGVIGTGSSAIQSIPRIAAEAAQVTVFQRTANFSVPAFNGPLDPEVEREHKARYREHRAFARTSSGGNPFTSRSVLAREESPAEQQAELEARYAEGGFLIQSAYADITDDADANALVADFVRARIRERVGDPQLAELLCPYDHPLATKRMCVDIDYFETYRRPNVRLVDIRETGIEEVTETGLRAAGEAFELDVLVVATGFDALTGALLAIDPRGRDGVALSDAWADGWRAYLGLAFAGFPNLFTVTGPGSPSVLSNMMVSIEQHVEWIADCLVYLRERGIATIEPTAEAEAAWVEHVRELGDASLYPQARSWYMGVNIPGKPRVLLPYVGGVGRYRAECERVVEAGYEGFRLGAGDRALAD